MYLLLILHLFIGATLAGVGIVGLLVAGFAPGWALLAVILSGFVVAFPVARVVAGAMRGD